MSKRLKHIAENIDINDKVIDVGCDHALLSIYLASKNIKVVASDVIQGAYDSAKKNISNFNMNKKVDLRLGDGLKVLKDDENINTVVLSGMGYQKIFKIYEESKQKFENIEKIIIQSNNFNSKIRRFFVKKNYYIINEELVKEKNIIYTIIVFKKGKKRYSRLEFDFGPIIITKKTKVFLEFLNIHLKKNKVLLKIIPKRYLIKRIFVKREIKNIIKIIKSF